jgi:hypothetical protein
MTLGLLLVLARPAPLVTKPAGVLGKCIRPFAAAASRFSLIKISSKAAGIPLIALPFTSLGSAWSRELFESS